MEDPQRLEPAERECLVEAVVDDQLLIRGYIDRLDVSPAGDLRVVDYKTGGAPREAFEARALFQLKFYALVLWRTRGVVPRSLRLLYLKDAEACDYSPDAEELTRFERNLVALWRAIERATERARLPPAAEPAVRLVLPPEPLPGLRRHPAAVPRAGAGRRRPRPRRCSSPRSESARLSRPVRVGPEMVDRRSAAAGRRAAVAADRLPHGARSRGRSWTWSARPATACRRSS